MLAHLAPLESGDNFIEAILLLDSDLVLVLLLKLLYLSLEVSVGLCILSLSRVFSLFQNRFQPVIFVHYLKATLDQLLIA